jgi:hypothetical protein
MNHHERTRLTALLADYGGSEAYHLEPLAAACRDRWGSTWPATADTDALLDIAGRHVNWGPPALTSCPDWCELEPGHIYLEDNGYLDRHHETRAVGTGRITSSIAQHESAASAAGPIHRSPLHALIVIDGTSVGDDFTPDDLRAGAAALLTTADDLERLIESASVSHPGTP